MFASVLSRASIVQPKEVHTFSLISIEGDNTMSKTFVDKL